MIGRLILCFWLALFAAPSWAGGSQEQVFIQSFQAISETDYIMVVAPKLPNGDPYMKACKRFEVHGTYARLKGAGLFYKRQVEKSSHRAAMAYLTDAFAHKKPVNFGWMGAGFEPIDAKNPCIVKSRALNIYNDAEPAVYSFFNAI